MRNRAHNPGLPNGVAHVAAINAMQITGGTVPATVLPNGLLAIYDHARNVAIHRGQFKPSSRYGCGLFMLASKV